MAQATDRTIDSDVRTNVEKFGARLRRDGIPVDALLIFGSYAKHRARKDSDIDVCVVSSAFGKDDVEEEMQMLFKMRRTIDTRVTLN